MKGIGGEEVFKICYKNDTFKGFMRIMTVMEVSRPHERVTWVEIQE